MSEDEKFTINHQCGKKADKITGKGFFFFVAGVLMLFYGVVYGGRIMDKVLG